MHQHTHNVVLERIKWWWGWEVRGVVSMLEQTLKIPRKIKHKIVKIIQSRAISKRVQR